VLLEWGGVARWAGPRVRGRVVGGERGLQEGSEEEVDRSEAEVWAALDELVGDAASASGDEEAGGNEVVGMLERETEIEALSVSVELSVSEVANEGIGVGEGVRMLERDIEVEV
jgi:hypothetical protein